MKRFIDIIKLFKLRHRFPNGIGRSLALWIWTAMFGYVAAEAQIPMDISSINQHAPVNQNSLMTFIPTFNFEQAFNPKSSFLTDLDLPMSHGLGNSLFQQQGGSGKLNGNGISTFEPGIPASKLFLLQYNGYPKAEMAYPAVPRGFFCHFEDRIAEKWFPLDFGTD